MDAKKTTLTADDEDVYLTLHSVPYVLGFEKQLLALTSDTRFRVSFSA